jgi:hypothetical protein
MADELAEAVKKAATAGDIAALRQLVAAHGGPAVRLDGDPAELTALHHLRLPQDGIHGNAPAHVRPLRPQVRQKLGVGAVGVFERIRKDGEPDRVQLA